MCKILCWISTFISAIGAINWGLDEFLDIDLIEQTDRLAGSIGLDKVLYGIVAVAGIYTLVSLFIFKD